MEPDKVDSEKIIKLCEDLARTVEQQKHELDFMSVVMDTIDSLVLVLDRNGIIIKFNRACERATGYTSEEAIGKAVWDIFILPEQIDGVKNVFENLKAGMFPNRYENYWLRKDGSRFLVSWSNNALVNTGGQVEYVVPTGIDITEQCKAENELKEAESRNRALLDAIPDMMFRMSADGVFLDFKGHKDSPTLIPPEEFLGKHIADLLPEEVVSRTMHHIKLALEDGEAQQFEYSLDMPKGNAHYEARIVVSGKDEIIAIVRDMTEHRVLEEQLLHSQKMEAIGTLTGGVAHEFNNIMTAILGFSEFLHTSIKPDGEGIEYVDMIETSALRAAKLTEGLLAYSRKQITRLEVADANEILRDVEGFLSKLVGPGIELTVSASAEPLLISADKSHLEQILVNLSTNAIAAMPNGGSLNIRAEQRSLDKDTVAHQASIPRGSYAVISVSDSGIGIDPNIQDKIFEPFFTTKDVGKGTGLGLSVVYGIIRKHRGYICVESAPSRGTTFRIFLPLLKDIKETFSAEESAAPVGGVETVLLAEDDDPVRKLVTQVLLNAGYDVIEASNGEVAVRKFIENQNNIDLLLLDYAMPAKNGRAAYEAIREISPEIKVIFMSGYVTDEKVRTELETSFPFLPKPLRQNELLNMLRHVLGTPGTTEDTSGE